MPNTNPHMGGMNRGNMPHRLPNMPHAMPQQQRPPQQNMPPMPQQQRPPQQNMPPMHLLNPASDPSVRFEPIPEGFAGSTGSAAANDLAGKISDLIQGETNSIAYYESLVKSHGVTEENRELVLELLNSKRQQVQNITDLYRMMAKTDWRPKEMEIESTKNFRVGISYALLQESRLLRDVSRIYSNINDEMQQRVMNSVLHSKIADIAHLMAI